MFWGVALCDTASMQIENYVEGQYVCAFQWITIKIECRWWEFIQNKDSLICMWASNRSIFYHYCDWLICRDEIQFHFSWGFFTSTCGRCSWLTIFNTQSDLISSVCYVQRCLANATRLFTQNVNYLNHSKTKLNVADCYYQSGALWNSYFIPPANCIFIRSDINEKAMT